MFSNLKNRFMGAPSKHLIKRDAVGVKAYFDIVNDLLSRNELI